MIAVHGSVAFHFCAVDAKIGICHSLMSSGIKLHVSPFSGVTVLDLIRIYNGPYAAFLMAQAGAEVIKIELLGGEHLRKRQGARGAAMPFAMTLNRKSEQGRAQLLRFVAQADVLVEKFAPGVMERLGLGEANPRRIYASSSGYDVV
jgi:formyl-CoA transferase